MPFDIFIFTKKELRRFENFGLKIDNGEFTQTTLGRGTPRVIKLQILLSFQMQHHIFFPVDTKKPVE